MHRTPPRRMVTRSAKNKGDSTVRSSVSSSAAAQIAKAQLLAAEEKAKIQTDLIEKRLALEIAEIESVCSRRSETHEIVEDWMRSHHELDTQSAHDCKDTGALCPSTAGVGTKGPGLRASASHIDFAATTEQTNQEPYTQSVHDEGRNDDVLCPPISSAGTDNTFRLLASAIKELATTSANNRPHSSLLSRLSTSKDLPAFSGDPLEFLQFKNAYEESSKVCNFSKKENLWRLRKCLRGRAQEAVSALLIGATTPEEVMDTLELQFGNPDIILSRIIMEVKKLNPVSQDYHKDIVSFSVKVRNCVTAVSAIGRDEYLVATDVITSVLSKLPPVILSKWTDYTFPLIKQGKRPTLLTLTTFLNDEAMKANAMALLNVRTSQNYGSTSRGKTSEHNRSHVVLMNNNDDTGANNCKYCRNAQHKLTDCKKFLSSMRREKWAFIKRNRLCFKCLLHKHGRETCSANTCDIEGCGLPHHRMLHYKRPDTTDSLHAGQCPASEENQDPEREPQRQSESVTHVVNTTSSCKVLLKVVRVNLHGHNGEIISTYALLDDGSTVSLISADLASRLGLHGRRDTIRVCGAWDSNELVCETNVVRLKISTCEGNNNYELYARSVKELKLPYQCSYPARRTRL